MLALKRHSEVCLTTNNTNATLTTDASTKHRRSNSTSAARLGAKKAAKHKASSKPPGKTPPQKSANNSKQLSPAETLDNPVEDIRENYESTLRELKIIGKIDLREFFSLICALRPAIKHADKLSTEEAILFIWKTMGGVKKQYVEEEEVFKVILYIQAALDFDGSISQLEKQIIKKRLEPLHKLKQLYPLIFKKTKPKKRQKSKSIKCSPFHSGSQLDVLVKIRDGVAEKISIFDDTSVDEVAVSLGLKHKLPLSKVKLVKKLIVSQLKKQLTRITEESSDTLSDLSDVFNDLE